MRRHRQIIRFGMWVLLFGVLAAWLAAAVHNPRRASTVFSVDFSPDGTLMALGTDDGNVVLADPQKAERLAVLDHGRFPNWTMFVRFSPAGDILVAGGDGRGIEFWEIASRRFLRTVNLEFGSSINCAAFSPDGTAIATGGENDTIRIWSAKDGSPPREIITSHRHRINAIAYSPDGTILATGSDDENVRLTEVETGVELATLFWDDKSEANTSVRSVAFSPDGQTLLAGMERGTLVLWDVPSRMQREVLHPHSQDIHAIAYARDGSRFATGSWDGTALVYDAASNQVLHTFAAESRWVWSVAFSPDGRSLATGGDSGTARVWDLATGTSRTIVTEPATVHWWLLGLLAWGLSYAGVRVKTSEHIGTEVRQSATSSPTPEPIAASTETLGPVPFFATLLLGGFLYACLCSPAIDTRGFPPIDPAWTAMTYLWPFPILLSAVFPVPGLRQRLKAVSLYCVATGFFDAAAELIVVPKHVDLLGTLVMTIFMYGPLHLLIGVPLALIAEGLRTAGWKAVPRVTPAVARAARWSGYVGIIAVAVSVPVVFRQRVFSDARARGLEQADLDWSSHKAEVRQQSDFEEGPVRHEFDPQTGLKYSYHFHDNEYSRAYDERVAELLRVHGVPDWSMKKHLVPDKELLSILDADEGEEVTDLPHEVNENILLFRRGTISRWGGTMSSSNDSLSIATKDGGLSGVAKVEPAYVLRKPEYPEVIFIRSGRSWVGAYHNSGQLLSSASRF